MNPPRYNPSSITIIVVPGAQKLCYAPNPRLGIESRWGVAARACPWTNVLQAQEPSRGCPAQSIKELGLPESSDHNTSAPKHRNAQHDIYYCYHYHSACLSSVLYSLVTTLSLSLLSTIFVQSLFVDFAVDLLCTYFLLAPPQLCAPFSAALGRVCLYSGTR
jgi:hypothetical protein